MRYSHIILTTLLLYTGIGCNAPDDQEKIIAQRLKERKMQNVDGIRTNIPQSYQRKKKIDFEFKEQRLPFLLGTEYAVNEPESIERFLADDDYIIEKYFRADYPYSCMSVNNLVRSEMKRKGISAALVLGDFSSQGFKPDFSFQYLTELDGMRAIPRMPHWYVVGKVRKQGIVNEIIFDYAADQFARGSIVPVVGPRDDLRSLYIITGDMCPRIDNATMRLTDSGMIKRR